MAISGEADKTPRAQDGPPTGVPVVGVPGLSEAATATRRTPVDAVATLTPRPSVRAELNEFERRLLTDLFAIVSEHAADAAIEIDRDRVEDAFVFACEHHAD